MFGISFCIPAHNEEKTISYCIRSIIKEMEWHDVEYEIIVVANACTDKTEHNAIMAGARVLIEPRKGIVYAKELCFKAAQFDFIANIDADNLIPIDNDWLVTVMKAFNDPKVVAVSGPFVFKDMPWWFRACTHIFYLLGRISHLSFGPMVQGGNFVIRKTALDGFKYNPDIVFYGEDTDIAAYVSKFGTIKVIPEMWVYASSRRMKGDGIVKTTWDYILNYFSITFRNKPWTTEYKDYR